MKCGAEAKPSNHIEVEQGEAMNQLIHGTHPFDSFLYYPLIGKLLG